MILGWKITSTLSPGAERERVLVRAPCSISSLWKNNQSIKQRPKGNLQVCQSAKLSSWLIMVESRSSLLKLQAWWSPEACCSDTNSGQKCVELRLGRQQSSSTDPGSITLWTLNVCRSPLWVFPETQYLQESSRTSPDIPSRSTSLTLI